MDESIFKKMRFKEGMKALVIGAPDDYPKIPSGEIVTKKADFAHLFVESKSELEKSFSEVADALVSDGLFWVSYPKSAKKGEHDINRDSLWETVIPLGFHPVSQVSLGDKWSAVRVRENVAGVEYVHPSKKKKV